MSRGTEKDLNVSHRHKSNLSKVKDIPLVPLAVFHTRESSTTLYSGTDIIMEGKQEPQTVRFLIVVGCMFEEPIFWADAPKIILPRSTCSISMQLNVLPVYVDVGDTTAWEAQRAYEACRPSP